MGYRKISYYLNDKGIKTIRGKEFSPFLVYSVLKRKKELDHRSDKGRGKQVLVKINRLNSNRSQSLNSASSEGTSFVYGVMSVDKLERKTQ